MAYLPTRKNLLPVLGACFILGCLLLSFSFPSFAQSPKAHSHPIIRTHTSSVSTPFGIRNTVESTNWAGYAVTGAGVSDVVGTWVVPSLTCSLQTTYVAIWVGIDGYSSSTVEQTGTLAYCYFGTAYYYAWYEFYPSSGPSLTEILYRFGRSGRHILRPSFPCRRILHHYDNQRE